MKLVDLLVQELPRRGGWPTNISYIAQDEGSATWGFRYKPEMDSDDEWMDTSESGYEIRIGYIGAADDCNTSVVSRKQYEAALAASDGRLEQDLNECIGQDVGVPEWNGDGLPPVGCECLASVDDGESWTSWYTMAVDGDYVIFGYLDGDHVAFSKKDMPIFLPLRTEAENAESLAIGAMERAWEEVMNKPAQNFEIIYEAIAAGKIPGVKLESK